MGLLNIGKHVRQGSTYEALLRKADLWEPDLPVLDADGNYPALQALAVLQARDILRARRELGLSQVELARRARIRPETLRSNCGNIARQIKNLDRATFLPDTAFMATVELTPEAAEQFDRLPRSMRARVNRIRERRAHWPEVSGIKALSGKLADWYRLRMGAYRVRFRVKGERIIVDKIGHRSEFYED